MVSGIRLVLGLRTRRQDPYVYVVNWPLMHIAVLVVGRHALEVGIMACTLEYIRVAHVLNLLI